MTLEIPKMSPQNILKFIYSEKVTNFAKSSPYFWLALHRKDKSKVKISQNFVAYSEYTNFTILNFSTLTKKVENSDFIKYFLNGTKLKIPLESKSPLTLKCFFTQYFYKTNRKRKFRYEIWAKLRNLIKIKQVTLFLFLLHIFKC